MNAIVRTPAKSTRRSAQPSFPAVTSSAPPPHANSSESLREKHGERYRWLLLFTVMIGTMASIMSSTIVNVAIPDMSRYFTLGPMAGASTTPKLKTPIALPCSCDWKARMMMMAGIGCSTPAASPSATLAAITSS